MIITFEYLTVIVFLFYSHLFSQLNYKKQKFLITLKFGVVQTAYANGRSTDYLVNKMVGISCMLCELKSPLESSGSMCTDWC